MAQQTTTHPYRAVRGDGLAFDLEMRDMLGDIKQMAVDFIALADDVADEVHDRSLLRLLAAIPRCAGRVRRTADLDLAELRREVPVAWRDYFDAAADVWLDLVGELLVLAGEQAFSRYEHQLCADYEAIAQCLLDNLELSVGLPAGHSPQHGARLLLEGHNMNFMGFETMDRMVLDNVTGGAAHGLRGGVYRDSATSACSCRPTDSARTPWRPGAPRSKRDVWPTRSFSRHLPALWENRFPPRWAGAVTPSRRTTPNWPRR